MIAAVVVFPGSNREGDMAAALDQASGRAPRFVWHGEVALPQGTDLVVLPGGFAHGDYLRCGAIAARSPIMAAVRAHAERGGLVLGVCNGFQVLLKAGLLPHGADGWPPKPERDVTLTWNENGKYTALWVRLKNLAPQNAFLRDIDEIELPIAHAEGRITDAVAAVDLRLDDEELAELGSGYVPHAIAGHQ